MNRPIRVIVIAAAMFCGVIVANTAEANLLVNGSFELGPDPGVFTPLGVGSTDITGWTATGGGVDYVGTLWPAADGVRSIDLDNSPGAGGLLQSFATIIGQDYEVTFNLAGNPAGGDPIKDMQVQLISGPDTVNYVTDFDTTGQDLTDLGWVNRSFTFVASGPTTSIELFSLEAGSSAFGPTIDNVAVNVVPEPASLALLAVGGLLALRRRRTATI